jgi:hypothetical protein
MDLVTRFEALLIELRHARAQLDRAESLLSDSRAGITARDARLGGAHEILAAHHKVEEARRLIEEARADLEREKASLPDRRPAH